MRLYTKCLIDKHGSTSIVVFKHGEFDTPICLLSPIEAEELKGGLEVALEHKVSLKTSGGTSVAMLESS